MKTWFENTSSLKKRKQRETIIWLLLILFFAWLVVVALKANFKSLDEESVASLQTSQLSVMRSYAVKSYAVKSYAYNSHSNKNDHTANNDSVYTNPNASIAEGRAPLLNNGSSLNEKQKLLRATRMHNTLRAVRKND